MIIKNYKEMCKILDEPEKIGNARKYQQIDWYRYFTYHKEGHKYVIDYLYTTPLPKVNHTGLNPNSHKNQSGAYGKYLRLLILNMLSVNDGNVINISKGYILEALNLVNSNYRFGNYNRKKLAKYLGMDIDFIHEFFNTSARKLKSAVEKSMNTLMNNESLIMWSNIKMIRTNMDRYDRKATKEEVKIILDCGAEALEDMGINDISHIYIANRVEEFRKVLSKKLANHKILRAYDGYEIIFSDMIYKKNEQLEYGLEIEEVEFNKSELNSTVYYKLRKSAVNRHNKVKKEADELFMGYPTEEWLSKNNYYKEIVLNEYFINNNKQLINICIGDGYDSISFEVNKGWEELTLKE